MNVRRFSSMLVLAAAAAFVPAGADEKDSTAAAQRFAALKKLAGDWVEVGKDGKPTEKIVSSFRLTAAGTVLEETVFPGSEDEMVTMYHLDGADLILTHYCTLGNQPRMRAEPGKPSDPITFKFVGATNLKSSDEHHMDKATLTFDGANHFKPEWISCENGKICHQTGLDLVRKQK